MRGLAGDSVVFLTKERAEWVTGRYVSCIWGVGKLTAKKGDSQRE